MKRIYKYELDVKDCQCVTMPKGSSILTVQMQHDLPRLWALVDPSITETEDKTIYIHGTRHDVIPEYFNYIGTFQIDGGSLIFHVLEGL